MVDHASFRLKPAPAAHHRMEYELAVDDASATLPGGSAVLLLHPSTGETDRIDTDFLTGDTDRFLVISTRTTAREVMQKLEYYDVDEDRATILDTLSVERGYSRRSSDDVHYVSAPDDVEGMLDWTERFLDASDDKRRISVDSITELVYYADEDAAFGAVERMIELLDEHDAVGLFHLSTEVHDRETLDRFGALFDATIELDDDGTVTTSF
jgi:KaiC/GvpD/RAD55 family RecA-like ATPase